MRRQARLRIEAAPVWCHHSNRLAWVPVVWHGQRLIGCYETEYSRADAISCAKFHARRWYQDNRGLWPGKGRPLNQGELPWKSNG